MSLAALGNLHVTSKRNSANFEYCKTHLREFLIFFFHNFFDSKIFSRSCNRHQKFDCKCLSCPGNKAKNPDFFTIFGMFELFFWAQDFNLGQ